MPVIYTDKEYQEIANLIKETLLNKKEFVDSEGDMDDIIAQGLNHIIARMYIASKLT